MGTSVNNERSGRISKIYTRGALSYFSTPIFSLHLKSGFKNSFVIYKCEVLKKIFFIFYF